MTVTLLSSEEEEVSEDEKAVAEKVEEESVSSPDKRDIMEDCHLLPAASAIEKERTLQKIATGAGQSCVGCYYYCGTFPEMFGTSRVEDNNS